MSNPFPHGASGTDSDGPFHAPFMPRAGSSHASVVSGSNTLALGPASLRTSRLSYLHPQSEPMSELYSQSLRNTAPDRDDRSPDLGTLPVSRVMQFPSMSRAFERNPADSRGWMTEQENTSFFTPSYLRGSTYITKLEEAHREKQAQKILRQQAGDIVPIPEGPLGGTAPASHLGITFDLVERNPRCDSAPALPLLPTRWDKSHKATALELSANGLEVKYNSALRTTREQDYETCTVRADHYMPSQAGIYYFEVAITSTSKRREDVTVCVGFVGKNVSLSRAPGWEPESWGFHGDDGEIYNGGNVGKKYADTLFGADDVVGCGVNFRTGQVFFTKNGRNLGLAFRDVKGQLYPAVGMKKAGEVVRVNFGQSPFVFNIDDFIETEQKAVMQAISKTSVERLVPPLKETELIQQLVLQFLQHDGYVETAQEFAQEILAEQQMLRTDTNVSVVDISVNDDDDARQRHRIRRAILEGDIDKALKLTNQLYPNVLDDNLQVRFELNCRKFIEMVRKAAEHNSTSGDGKKSNGHSREDSFHPNEMDVDDNDSEDDMEDDMTDASTDPDTLLRDTIRFGQYLRAEFRDCSKGDFEKRLNDIFASLAYSNPLEAKEVAHLLDKRGRISVAEELNSAILSSLGKSSRSALEDLYGQTSVLLDFLREDGGPGSLVSIQSVVDSIPKCEPL